MKSAAPAKLAARPKLPSKPSATKPAPARADTARPTAKPTASKAPASKAPASKAPASKAPAAKPVAGRPAASGATGASGSSRGPGGASAKPAPAAPKSGVPAPNAPSAARAPVAAPSPAAKSASAKAPATPFRPLVLAKSAAAPKPAAATKTAEPKAPEGTVAVATAADDRAGKGSRKPKPPAKTMKVPPPVTDILVKRELPDVRRLAGSTALSDTARGLVSPSQTSRPREAESRDEPPVDARLIASSLAGDVQPRIEDNYDYTILSDFVASGNCPAPTRMVNTGCGGGEAAVFFARRGFNVVGIDSDRTAVGLARERAWLASAEIDFMVGDLFETPNLLPAESFGLAFDRGAFYRLNEERDRQRYLQNIRRLLFKGGVFVLSCGFFPLSEEERAKARGAAKGPRKPTPKILLVREGGVVVNEVRQAGFDVLKRVLRPTGDSGEMGELILYLVR